ncbi:MAG TPA: periplasmic heavy metal sensor [Rubellimicrobium sp.]|nr:periplasmic heavy metal sensor [Rubellimicrobium sp.]
MTTESIPRSGLSTPLRWLLVVSLALNLLVAGLVAGAALRHDGPRRHMEMGPGPFAQALSPDDRQAILAEIRDRPGLGPPSREERKQAMTEVLAALRSEPFDRMRAEAAMASQSDRVATVQRAIQAAMVERLASMAPEDRAAFADRLEKELERGPNRD